jgi:hypothetical protein
VKEGVSCGVLLEEGAHLSRGAHHHLWEALLRGGSFNKGKEKERQGSKIKKRKGQSKGKGKMTKG